MSFRNFLTGLNLLVAVSFIPYFPFNCEHAWAAPQGQELISESKSALQGTRQCLSEFDSKLEFPMSAKEKTDSQKQLNSFRAAFSISKPLSAKMVSTKAQETLQTARQAAKEAESGDRSKALKLFTRARIKLFETKNYLSELENRGGTFNSTASTKLSGRARKNERLNKTRLSGQNSTRIDINASGINVDDRSGSQRSQVSVNPSGINVNEDGTRTSISVSPSPTSKQAPIDISPAGVRVGAPGGPSVVNVDPSGIQVGTSGQQGNGGISIGADGIRIGGIGQTVSDIVKGSVGAALSTAGIQTGVNSNTVFIAGRDNVKTIRMNGQNLSVTGRNNKITVIGYCRAVSVTGHDNIATVDVVSSINVTGHDNKVLFKQGTSGQDPQLSNLGRNNQIRKIQ